MLEESILIDKSAVYSYYILVRMIQRLYAMEIYSLYKNITHINARKYEYKDIVWTSMKIEEYK